MFFFPAKEKHKTAWDPLQACEELGSQSAGAEETRAGALPAGTCHHSPSLSAIFIFSRYSIEVLNVRLKWTDMMAPNFTTSI